MFRSRTLVRAIREVLDDVAGQLPTENVRDAREYLEHGEWGEALSLICTQLYEYDVPLSSSTYERIERLGRQMGIESKEWEMLSELVQRCD